MFKFIWNGEYYYAEHNPSIRADSKGNIYGGGTTKMGSESTSKPTPTPEETRLNQLEIQRQEATQPGLIQAQTSGLSLVNQMLTGSQALPGVFGQIAQGIVPQQQMDTPSIGSMAQMTEGQIDPNAVNAQAATLTRRYMPQYQQGGLMDSGIAGSDVQRRLSNELLLPVETQNIANRQNAQSFNISTELDRQSANIANQMATQQFNIGQEYSRQGFNQSNLLNLLNLALSGQAQVQQPVLAANQDLGQRLAGLRTQTVTQRGFQTQSPFSMVMQAGQLGINAFSAMKG